MLNAIIVINIEYPILLFEINEFKQLNNKIILITETYWLTLYFIKVMIIEVIAIAILEYSHFLFPSFCTLIIFIKAYKEEKANE